MQSLSVKDALNGADDIVNLNFHLIEVMKEMKSFLNNEDDRCVWFASMNGNFTIKSTWNIIRRVSFLDCLSIFGIIVCH